MQRDLCDAKHPELSKSKTASKGTVRVRRLSAARSVVWESGAGLSGSPRCLEFDRKAARVDSLEREVSELKKARRLS